jgi:glycosyltransferase involved in cell wall biosynthesis
MRILVIADYLPYPLIGGDRIRIYNLMRRIAGRHEVALTATLEKPEDAEGVPHLRQFCSRVEVAGFQQRGRLAKIPGLLRYALEGKPPELSLLYSNELVRKIRMLAAAMDFDIVQIEHSHMALYLAALPADGHCRSILEFHNIASQQYKRFSSVQQQPGRKARSWLNSVMMKNWEPRFAEKFDRCAAVSETDRQFLLKANPRLKVAVIPNGVDIEHYRPLPVLPADRTPSLLFIGNMGYPPCADAALYFCREIFPLIQPDHFG